jgi:hypothetical protein
MIYRVSDTFPSNGIDANTGLPDNLTDQQWQSSYVGLGGLAGAGWTTGAVLMKSITAGRNSPNSFSLLSMSVQGSLMCNAASGQFPFGKWASILTGISTLPPPSFPVTTNPGTVQPLPQDSSLVTTFFDPDNDPMPPTNIPNGPLPIPISATLTLPQPIRIESGMNISAGLWMLPSLLGGRLGTGFGGYFPSRTLLLLNCSYTLVYDDLKK